MPSVFNIERTLQWYSDVDGHAVLIVWPYKKFYKYCIYKYPKLKGILKELHTILDN